MEKQRRARHAILNCKGISKVLLTAQQRRYQKYCALASITQSMEDDDIPWRSFMYYLMQ
jgi:hypothetical protein